ncbi:MAG: prepilin-type N-terminal cleavage/methylation domain-containing protein [Planctomycetes bacterium]|nr:prepilin-type N-terminal cleavage/methylation domain-containing protein [Planctomycetota bacterium]
MKSLRRSCTSGFTLVELAISSVVFGVILSATLGASFTAQNGFSAAVIRSRLEQRAQRALDLILDEFGTAGQTGLTPASAPPLGSFSLTYRRPTGIAAGAITWGNASTVLFEYTADEPNNGVDDDGDGLVDEGRIVLIRNVGLPTERRTVLATGVPELMPGELANGLDDNGDGLADERGLAFSVASGVLTIRLALGEADAHGRRITSIQRIAIQLRN